MVDRALAVFAFLCFAGFLMIVIVSVPRPMLIVVGVVCMALAAYDFWLQLARDRR